MKNTTMYNASVMQESAKTFNFWENSLARYSERNYYPDERDNFNISGKGAVSLANELRNPLTSVKGFLQFIEHKKELISETKLKRYSELMINEIHYMENVISDLLLVQKPEVSQFVNENMISLVKESIKQIEQTHPIQVDLHAHTNLPLVKCVREQMIKVLVDLFQKKIKSMPEDEALTINMASSDSSHLKITIADNEAIDSPQYIERIDNVVDANNEYGLGLIIGLNIVKNHGGTIQVYRNKSKGLIFEVILPFNPC